MALGGFLPPEVIGTGPEGLRIGSGRVRRIAPPCKNYLQSGNSHFRPASPLFALTSLKTACWP